MCKQLLSSSIRPAAVVRLNKRQRNVRVLKNLTFTDYRVHFHKPCEEAAEAMGMPLSTFKLYKKLIGIKQWPYRTFKGIMTMLSQRKISRKDITGMEFIVRRLPETLVRQMCCPVKCHHVKDTIADYFSEKFDHPSRMTFLLNPFPVAVKKLDHPSTPPPMPFLLNPICAVADKQFDHPISSSMASLLNPFPVSETTVC